MPDVPAIEEIVPGYVVTTWYSLVAPRGTPKEVVDKLNAEINAIVKLPDIAKQLHAHGLDADPMTPEQLGQHLRKESSTWAKVASDAKMQAQ
jgi:tripartite-type tricarboxylate transporter receptor subunit TctC